MKHYDVIVVGGGLAGLTAALHLTRQGLQVLLVEKHAYPRHKVCGEYLSREVCPYLSSLGLTLIEAVQINKLQLSAPGGNSLEMSLPLGGIGISRYHLDHKMFLLARQEGVHFVFGTVQAINREANGFVVNTNSDSYRSRLVIGAYGKRAALDKELQRGFIQKSSPWLAAKAHYDHKDWPADLVGLYAFKGGYAGISRTESGAVNFCYLASYRQFKPCGNLNQFLDSVVAANPLISNFLDKASPIFSEPLTIAQIAFQKKETEVNGVLMCGDTAGMIHPLCGNGMAMAIHSAKLASETILDHWHARPLDLKDINKGYRQKWDRAFSSRLAYGRVLQQLLLSPRLAGGLISLATGSPWLVRNLIRATHGNPIEP